jgi:CheY-like chemotaxis protein
VLADPCKTVMVVEDDRDVREALVEALADHEYDVLEASNGEEALSRLRAAARKPCVILLDIMMPVMDGWQFREAQQRAPDVAEIPVVVLSAHANLRDAVTGMGVQEFLKKPVRLEALIHTIRRYCA